MKTDDNDRRSTARVANRSTDMVIYATIADTTWRMFVPVLLGALLGYLWDKWQHTTPVGVLVGLGIGIVMAVSLVVMQYRQVTRGGKS